MTAFKGSDLSDHSADAAERAFGDVEWERISAIDVDAILDIWDPERVPADLLLLLGTSLGVNLWSDDWSEAAKRYWLAVQWIFLSRRGTLAGIKMAVEQMGGTVVQAITPPQGFYLSEEPDDAAWQRYLDQMPQLRVSYKARFGDAGPEMYVGDFFLGDPSAFLCEDTSRALMGPTAIVVYPDGRIEDLVVLSYDVRYDTQQFGQRRYVTQGNAENGFALNHDGLGLTGYLGVEDKPVTYITYDAGTELAVERRVIRREVLSPGLEPLRIDKQRIVLDGDGSNRFFVGDALGHYFLPGPGDETEDGWYDLTYLNDPTVAVPLTQGMSFLGHARMQMPAKTAELRIEAHTFARPSDAFLDDGHLGEMFLIEEDQSRQDGILDGVVAGKALLDKVAVTFETLRPRSLDDGLNLDVGFTFGEYVSAIE